MKSPPRVRVARDIAIAGLDSSTPIGGRLYDSVRLCKDADDDTLRLVILHKLPSDMQWTRDEYPWSDRAMPTHLVGIQTLIQLLGATAPKARRATINTRAHKEAMHRGNIRRLGHDYLEKKTALEAAIVATKSRGEEPLLRVKEWNKKFGHSKSDIRKKIKKST